jgi:FkbM family methyltransferase
MIEAAPYFAGAATFQFRKFAAAFPYIKNFRHAVDVGAHVGLWTRVLMRCFGMVTAFEPNPECEEYFWLNNPWRAYDKSSQAIFKSVGLGHFPGKLKLNTQLPKSTAFTRIDPDGDTEIDIRTLDSFQLENVDFIKIDVEGWEAHVVRGGEETIRRWRPTMILEQKPGNAERHGMRQYEAVELLESWGAKRKAEVSGDVIVTFK